jgi:predicted kinase
MSKELIIVIGIPHSGRSTWINKTYIDEETVVIDENDFEGLYKNKKIQESFFFNSNEWVANSVKKVMEELKSPRIVVSLLQSRPDHWRDILQHAVANEYNLSIVIPKYDYYYYCNTRLSGAREQVSASQKTTSTIYPKTSKIKLATDDEEAEKENINLYTNIITEFQSALAFYFQNKAKCLNDTQKWLDVIESQFKNNFVKAIANKAALALKATKEAEKEAQRLAKEAEKEAQRLAKEAEKEAQRLAKEAEIAEKDTEVITVQTI